MANDDKIWTDFFDVVILPPPEIRDYAIELSAKLHEHGTPWKLGLEERLPHLSLFHFSVHPKDLSFSHRPVRLLTRKMCGGDLQLTSISSPRHGATFLNTDCPSWLTNAARETSQILRKEGVAIEDPRFIERWRQMELTSRMEANIHNYGSPFMNQDFIPHFTLGVLKDKARAQDIAASLSFRGTSWTVDRLYIVQVGDGWTAWDILAGFPTASAR